MQIIGKRRRKGSTSSHLDTCQILDSHATPASPVSLLSHLEKTGRPCARLGSCPTGVIMNLHYSIESRVQNITSHQTVTLQHCSLTINVTHRFLPVEASIA